MRAGVINTGTHGHPHSSPHSIQTSALRVGVLNVHGFTRPKRTILTNSWHIFDILVICEHWFVEQSWFLEEDCCVISSIPSEEDMPSSNNRLRRTLGGVAIFVRQSLIPFVSWTLGTRSLAVVDIGGVMVVGCYFPPSWDISKVSAELSKLPSYAQPHIVAGDFNCRWRGTNVGLHANKTRCAIFQSFLQSWNLNLLSERFDSPDHIACERKLSADAKVLPPPIQTDHLYMIIGTIDISRLSTRDLDPYISNEAHFDRFHTRKLASNSIKLAFADMLSIILSIAIRKHKVLQEDPKTILNRLSSTNQQILMDQVYDIVLGAIHAAGDSCLGHFDPGTKRRWHDITPLNTTEDGYEEVQDCSGVEYHRACMEAFKSRSSSIIQSSTEKTSAHESTVNHFRKVFASPPVGTDRYSIWTESNPTHVLKAFSAPLVREACLRYPSGKANGFDGIDITMFHAVANCCESHPLFEVLSWLFRASICSGNVPNLFKINIVKPIAKGDKQFVCCIEDTRPISVSPIIRRIMEKIILGSLVEKDHGSLSDAELSQGKVGFGSFSPIQGGFRSGNSCSCHILTLHESIQQGQKVVAFLDYRWAYDTVPIGTVITRLHDRLPLQGKCLAHIISSLFSDNIVYVAVNGTLTIPITLKRGLSQGSPLSPPLFNVFIDPLARDLQASASSIPRALLLADDIVVFGTNQNDLFIYS